MNANLDTMLPKESLIWTEHCGKHLIVIGRYDSGFTESVVGNWALTIKKVRDVLQSLMKTLKKDSQQNVREIFYMFGVGEKME